MTWGIGLVITFAFVLPVGLGFALGAYRAIQNPAFVGEAGALIVKALFPLLKELVLRRNSPEIEAQMQAVIRRGGKWDNYLKRERK